MFTSFIESVAIVAGIVLFLETLRVTGSIKTALIAIALFLFALLSTI